MVTQGILITPDFTLRTVSVALGELREGSAIPVALDESTSYLAYPVEEGGVPNPAASLAKNRQATGNPAFLADPTAALRGDVVCVRADGEDATEANERAAAEVVRAARAYCEDYPEEYALWRSAAGR
ncbi:hypothetical protein CXB45_04920 [Corynebacterium mastitidis]|uniref:Uncharacterized protein n=1 Tax=Corynebacterium mastitidis TaxID=161890 RepID=A0A2N0X828_9CORY|nr:hypothetical protein CXB45_04920 [Corynebacterium mastitidis]